MGASGTGTFDNDDAMDWLGGFGPDGVATVQDALEAVVALDPTDYIETDTAAHALAAAEVLAAARDGDTSRLPKEAVSSVKENAAKLNSAKLLASARKAVLRVLKNSELREQWEETGDIEEWDEDVRELLERLKG